MINARHSRNAPAPRRNRSKDRDARQMVRRSADVDLGTSKSMVLSFLFHGLLAVGLFAFDGLNSKPWRQVGAASSAPQLIEVEMLAAPMNAKKSVQVKSPAAAVSDDDIQKQSEASSNSPTDAVASRAASSSATASSAGSDAANSANSNNASVASSTSAKLADAEMVYLNDLRQLLESKKEYPIAARRMGHRGRVVVRFVLERDGRVRTAEIVQGSQSEILNRAARGLIGRLHDVKPFPKEVALTEWAVVVPIEYQM